MLNINHQTFFAYARKAPFGGRLTQEQSAGVEFILRAFAKQGRDLRHLAYILATAFHETGGRMIPVREGFAKTDAGARKITAKYKYGKPDPVTGHVYYGRGHVQLTWADNYKRMGRIMNLPLYQQPDLALEPETSAFILVEGMMRGMSAKGDFTGKSVEDYFNDTVDDPEGARRIVNGTDKNKLIAGYHHNFLDALKAATADEQPDDVTAKAAAPDKPNLLTDKTTLGAATAFVSAGGFSFLDNINTGWTFAALVFMVLAALGVWLFVSGRLKIIRKGGV